MSPKAQMLDLFDCLTESDQALVVEIIKRFVADDDDIATEDDIESAKIAHMEYQNGETIDINDYNWK